MDLFDTEKKNTALEPLAYRMRPKDLDGFFGQPAITGEKGFLRKALDAGKIPSMILWGPPGTGKTTLASIIAGYIKADFIPLSAVTSGIKDVKVVVEKAKFNMNSGRKTILFIDEIHRFNKAQQDAFLPHVENGTVILIGATTENPSFEVNSALLSRSKVLKLKQLGRDDIHKVIKRALADAENGLGKREPRIEESAVDIIDAFCSGDARMALNIIETADSLKKEDQYTITARDIESVLSEKSMMYDKSGEEHYNLISAFIKSMRGSDPDGALYWAVRMLESGEDPLFLARRMIIFASEDVGNADPNALLVANAAREAYHVIGSPEGEINLMHAVTYLASAPKSNASYAGFRKAQEDVREKKALPVPEHLRNAPTRLMKEIGYGKGYKYAHDYEGNYAEQQYLPDELKGRKYYEPGDNGYEAQIKERFMKWRKKQ